MLAALLLLLVWPQAQAQSLDADGATKSATPNMPSTLGGSDLLYDQTDDVLSGVIAQYNATNSDFDVLQADNFTVPNGLTWALDVVAVTGFYSSGATTGDCERATVIFWGDMGDGEPDAQLFTFDDIAPFFDSAGPLTIGTIGVELPQPVVLSSGDYWFTLVCEGDNLDSGVAGRWNWQFNDEPGLDPDAQFRNDGGGFGVPVGWNDFSGLFNNGRNNSSFALFGFESGTALLPELEVEQRSLFATAPPDEQATRVLTLRNTGTDDLEFSFDDFDGPTAAPTPDLPMVAFRGYPTLQKPEGGSVFARTGSDAFGYTFKDNDEPDGPAYSFIDISGTGTPLNLSDDAGATIPLPFAFTFYGVPHNDVTVSSNGYLTFGTDGSDFSNDPIPSGTDPNDFIAPFWDDLNPADADSDNVYYEDLGDGRFIVQWEVVAFGGSAGEELSFQVVLFQTGAIEFRYRDMLDPAESATIGIENPAADDGLEISFNEAGYAQNGRIIRIEEVVNPFTDFITDVSPASGTLAPGEDINVTVTFDADGLGVGVYEDEIALSTNAGNVAVPATLEVVGPPEIFVDPLLLEATLDSGETEDRPITITNTGLTDLEYEFLGYAPLNIEDRAPANYGQRAGRDFEKGEEPPSTEPAQRFGAGGPDAFGYVWIDSNESGGPDYQFTDISATGTQLNLGDDDGASVALPFPFPFYGDTKSDVTVGSNGYLTFGADGTDFTNDPIPSATDPNDLIAVLWDDFNPADGASQGVFYEDMGDGRFIVQWNVVAFAGSVQFDFQAVLFANGSMEFQYANVDEGDVNSATVGIENADASDGLQVAFDQDYLEDQLAVRISVPDRIVESVSPASGTIAPGEQVSVTATLSAAELFAGEYTGALEIVSNDPVRQLTIIDVTMLVTGDPAVSVAPTTIGFGEVMLGDSATETVTVTNTGTDALTITGISSSGTPFATTGAASTTLAPGESTTFDVVFAPQTLASFSGTVTVNTDAGPVEISVAGVAAPAPVASVTPESLNPSTPDDVDELVLMNDGVGVLEYTVTATDMARLPDGAAPSDPIATVTDNPVVSLLTAPENATTTPGTAGAARAPGDVLFTGAFASGSPLGITQSPDGNVWVADLFNGVTEIFDADLNPVGTINHPVAGGNPATVGIAYNGNTGTLWYLNFDQASGAPLLIESDLNGTATGNTLPVPVSAAGNLPAGVEYSPALGQYFYIDISDDDIFAIDETGAVVSGYPVPQTSGDDGSGTFGNGLDVLGSGLDVVYGASAAGQATEAVVTDLNGVNVGAATPFAQTGDTFVNDVTRSRIAPNEIMYVVGNSSSTIYAVEPAFREDLEGGGGNEVDYISVSPSEGTVGPAQNETLTVTYDDEGLEAGTYMATIVIATNDPENPVLQVPVTLVVAGGVSNEDGAAPVEFSLDASVPNPAASRTALRYSVPETSDVLIEVYDLMGRRIVTLVDGEQTPGTKTVQWDASALAGGVYVYRMTAGTFAQTLKMVVVR